MKQQNEGKDGDGGKQDASQRKRPNRDASASDPERPTTLHEEQGEAIQQLDDPPKAEG